MLLLRTKNDEVKYQQAIVGDDVRRLTILHRKIESPYVVSYNCTFAKSNETMSCGRQLESRRCIQISPSTKKSSKYRLRNLEAGAIVNQMVKHSAEQLDTVFAALSDPTRRRILETLAAGESLVTRLAAPFNMSLPAVSKHLRVLENAGLLKRTRVGREHRIELEAEPMKEALQWMERYRRFWEGSLGALADYLENTSTSNKKKGKSGK
jgi:DNA-binding transcriptional ArsR family regulator